MSRYRMHLVLSLVLLSITLSGAAQAETISLPPPPEEDAVALETFVSSTPSRGVRSPAFLAYQARRAARLAQARQILRARNQYASQTDVAGRIAGVRHTYITTDRIGYVTGVSVAAPLLRQLGR